MDETYASDLLRIDATWKEIGQSARPLRRMVFLRTELLPEKVGLIFIPPDQRGNYSQLPHKVLMRALVLSVGPKTKLLKAGDRVVFPRLFFARWHHMEDRTLVGWVDEENIVGYDLTKDNEAVHASAAE